MHEPRILSETNPLARRLSFTLNKSQKKPASVMAMKCQRPSKGELHIRHLTRKLQNQKAGATTPNKQGVCSRWGFSLTWVQIQAPPFSSWKTSSFLTCLSKSAHPQPRDNENTHDIARQAW